MIKRTKFGTVFTIVVLVAVLSACFLVRRDANATTAGCTSSPYWKFAAVQLMCNDSYQVASMWIAANTNCDSFVQTTSTSGSTVDARLCGMYDSGEGAHNATYISIWYNDDGAIYNVPSEMYRGYYLSPTSVGIKINVDKFISRASKGSSSGGYTSYTRVFGVYRCNGAVVPPRAPSDSFCGADDVSVTIMLPDYNFKTNVETGMDDGVVYNNESVNVRATVTTEKANASAAGDKKTSGTLDFVEFYLEPEMSSGANLSGDLDSSKDPCSFFKDKLGNSIGCKTFESKSVEINGSNKQILADTKQRKIPEDLEIGAKYCIAAGVNPTSSNSKGDSVNKNWNISGATCRTVAKKPSMDIIGNIFANGQVNSSLSSKVDGMNYGSWGQYLVVANGEVVNFASGSAFGVGTNDLNKTFPLTIANKDSKDSKDKLGKAKISTLSAFGNNVRNYCGAGNLDSDYDIKSNVSSFQIICGKNINISPSVKEINAWLIADNTINTCAGVSNDDLYDKCNNKLTINGLVYAKDLILNRTYGAEYSTDYYTTAEEINLTTDGYKHAYEQKSGASDRANYLYTRYQKELLPRY